MGQTITLGLNLRLQPSLGNLAITGPYMTTYAATSCVNGSAVPGTKVVYVIPQAVLNCLGVNNKVSDLLALANQALGNALPSGCTASLSDISAALNAINVGFDKCRVLAGFSTNPSGVRMEVETALPDTDETQVFLTAHPNPFSRETTVEFAVEEAASVSLEVYSHLGVKVETLFEGNLEAHQSRSITLHADNLPSGVYVCKLLVNGRLHQYTLLLTR